MASDKAVPAFIGAGRWTFGGKLETGCRAPLDFDDRAADTAVRFRPCRLIDKRHARLSDADRIADARDFRQ